MTKTCPDCQATVHSPRANNVTCTQCGTAYSIEPDKCQACGCQGFSTSQPNRMGTTLAQEELYIRFDGEITELLDRAAQFVSSVTNRGDCGPHHLISDLAAALRVALAAMPAVGGEHKQATGEDSSPASHKVAAPAQPDADVHDDGGSRISAAQPASQPTPVGVEREALASSLEAALKFQREAGPADLRHAHAQLADVLFGHVEPIIAALRDAQPASPLRGKEIIEQCASIAENFECGRKWSDDPDMQNQAYYTEGEVAAEIAEKIRALSPATVPVTGRDDVIAECAAIADRYDDCGGAFIAQKIRDLYASSTAPNEESP